MISKLVNKPGKGNIELPPVDTLLWPAMPDPRDPGSSGGKTWIWPYYRCNFQVGPGSAHGEGYLEFPYAASAFDRRGTHVLTVALERTDYRMLARMTGQALKDLAPGPNIRFSPVAIVVYRASIREDVGLYTEELSLERAAAYLCDIVMDELEIAIEPLVQA